MAPLSSPPPPMKLLASQPKSRSKSIATTASSSSSTASVPPPSLNRSTRNLPNLCDCHCCARRIDRANPRDHLQALDSVWRIVLLCRKCNKSVHSGQTCSYCFRETANFSQDLYQCRLCRRRIHKDCVRGFTNCSPWCNLRVETGLDEFGVCVDCWVPDLLKNSVRVSKRGEKKRGRKSKAEAEQLLENKAVKDAKCDHGRMKMVRAAEKKRTKVTENVVDLANVVTHRNSSSGAIDVAYLANQLEILNLVNSVSIENISALNCASNENSSIGKDSGESQRLGTSAHDTDSERMVLFGENELRNDPNVFNKELLHYQRDRKRKLWQLINTNTVVSGANQQKVTIGLYSGDTRTWNPVKGGTDIPEVFNDVNADKSYPCNSFDRFEKELLSDMRSAFRGEVCQVNGSYDIPECSSVSNGLGKDANRLNIGLVTYKRDSKRKKWQLDGEKDVVSESSNQKVMSNLFLADENRANASEGSADVSDDPNKLTKNVNRFDRDLVYKRRKKACQVNGSVDVPGRSIDTNTQVSGAKLGLLTYKRDRKRKRWQLDESDKELVNFKSMRLLNAYQVNSSVDAAEGSVDFIRPNMGFVPYKSDCTLMTCQRNVKNTVVSEVSKQEKKSILRLEYARIQDVSSSTDLSEGSFDVNADQRNQYANVDTFGQELLCFKRAGYSQEVCHVNDSNEGSVDVNGMCNIYGLNLGVLTYKRDRKRKIWQVSSRDSGL